VQKDEESEFSVGETVSKIESSVKSLWDQAGKFFSGAPTQSQAIVPSGNEFVRSAIQAVDEKHLNQSVQSQVSS